MANKSPATQMTSIFGKPGEVFIQTYYNEEKRLDDLKITDYRHMLDNDGVIQALWNAITNTIMSAGFKVQDDNDYQGEESSEEKQFIEKLLFEPVWKGGMKLPFEVVSKTMLRAFIEGYRTFEVVWKVGEDGKYYIDKLAPRAGKTDMEFYLIVDDNGEFIGFRQRVSFMGQITDIVVKNEGELKKVIKATFGEEFGSTYGRSGLKAAWYHYDKAHKGMYLNHIGHELGAVKYRNFKHTIGDGARVKEIVDELGKVGMESVGAFNKNEGELFFESVSDAGVLQVGKDMIMMHYSLIAKSLLAQFIDLGSVSSTGGSRALGQNQTDFFKQGLQSMATIIIENTWNEVIADLIKANFDRGVYPTLKTNPIETTKSDAILDAFTEIVKSGEVSSSVMTELQTVAAEKLDLDVTEEQIMADLDQKKADKQAQLDALSKMQPQQPFQQQGFPAKQSQDQPEKAGVKLDDSINGEPIRALYPDENKVRLSDIKRKLTTSEMDAKDLLRQKMEAQKNLVVDQYLIAMRAGKKAITKTDVNLSETQSKYSEEIRSMADDLLNFGKAQVAMEISKPVPVTTKSDSDALAANIALILADQESKLNFRLKQAANNALDAKMPENQARLILDQEFDSFMVSIINGTVASIIPTYFNKGRQISFGKYASDIFAYRYTAVLDDATTDYCRAMDGRVFQSNDPEYVMVTPPNHFGCRSFWTPILNDEADGVSINGKPGNVPMYGSLSSFKDLQMSDTETKIEQLLKML